MTNYFKDCKTQDDIKKIYRELAKKLHPDMGGSKDEMTELTRQYDEMIKYGPTGNHFNRFERSSTMNHEEVLKEGFKKAQEEYQRSYGGYGGYRYANQGSMWSEYKQQANDPRIADYERIKQENSSLKFNSMSYLRKIDNLQEENEKLKKKLERIEKKLAKPLKKKKKELHSVISL